MDRETDRKNRKKEERLTKEKIEKDRKKKRNDREKRKDWNIKVMVGDEKRRK